ncbi:MAG: sulfotransferase domain-containing protein [Ectothiorhodospiraceae bacterium]|nr:sulfotransferase domain-containing protein [Ectothiorhodospiraceae bacterium]
MDTTIDKKWGNPDPTHDPYALANFRARPTDVLITTAAKAGTTWMQQILHQLRTGGDENFYSIDSVVPWLEVPRDGKHWSVVLAAYEQIPDPRVFKTHCTYPQTPGISANNNSTARIILTSRDPRDCCISFYHHKQDMTDAAKAKMGITENQTFEVFLDEWLHYESWYRNMASWWPHRNDNNILWLRFEDLKLHFNDQIDKILYFLKWEISDEQRQRVLHLCSFDWMKENSIRFARQNNTDEPMFKPGGFIRKGKIGEGKSTLTAEQEERILNKARDRLPPDCLVYLGLTPST